nr:hypothetical protein Iba_chr01fCG0920 [Ipomoea batatas]
MTSSSNADNGLSSANGIGQAGKCRIGQTDRHINRESSIELETYGMFICRKRRPRMAREQSRTIKTSETRETKLDF